MIGGRAGLLKKLVHDTNNVDIKYGIVYQYFMNQLFAEKWLESTVNDGARARSLIQALRKGGLLPRPTKKRGLAKHYFTNIVLSALHTGGPTKVVSFIENTMADLRNLEVEYDNNDGSLYSAGIEQVPDFHNEWMREFGLHAIENVPNPTAHSFFSELLLQTGNVPARNFHRYDNISIEINGLRVQAAMEFHEANHGVSASGWREEGKGNRRVKLTYSNDVDPLPNCTTVTSRIYGGAINTLIGGRIV